MANKIEHVTVKTIDELKRAIKPFSKDGRENARKILVDNLLKLKAAIEEHKAVSNKLDKLQSEFDGIAPARMNNPADGYHYIDDIINVRLGGKRIGYKIRWAINSGIYEWDAITDELTKL